MNTDTTKQAGEAAHTPIQAQDEILPTPEVNDAANKFCRDNWNGLLKIAEADSSYTAYWAFCAGAKFRARNSHAALVAALDTAQTRLTKLYHGGRIASLAELNEIGDGIRAALNAAKS